METTTTLEQVRIKQLTEEYRRGGYEVIVRPKPHQLPDFLEGYLPDMIVGRDGEWTAIAVKSRRALAAGTQTRDLARLIENRPDWNFELIVVSDERPHESMEVLDPRSVRRGIEEAMRLADNDFAGPALLTGWAALEAALRLLLNAEGVKVRLPTTRIVEQAVEEGVISRGEYRMLSALMRRRNALAHGFRSEAVHPSQVSTLLSLTRRLLDEAAPAEIV